MVVKKLRNNNFVILTQSPMTIVFTMLATILTPHSIVPHVPGPYIPDCGSQLFILSRKGGILLVINDFIYRSNLKRHGRETNKIYWECIHNRSKKCRSRLKTVGDDLFVTNEIHNHKSDADRIKLAKQAGMLIFNRFSMLGTPNRPFPSSV